MNLANVFKWFYNSGVGKTVRKLTSYFGNVVDSLIKQATGSGATGRDKELSDMSLQNAQTLAEEDYQRKIEFYEKYESPEAMRLQYQSAGFNPYMLAGSGQSTSASGGVGVGSASARDTNSALGSILGSVFGMITKMQQIATDRMLTGEANDIKRYESQTNRLQAENYGRYLDALTVGQQQKNDVFYTLFGLQASEIESNIALKNSQSEYFVQVASSESVRRQLMQSGIRLNDVNAAMAEVQKAILSAQSKYSDKYFKAVAEMQDAQASMARIEANAYEKANARGLVESAACAELADMVFKAGMDLDIWEGDAFKKSVSGEMTKKDWTGAVMGLLKSVIAGGAVAGAAAIRGASRAVVPPMVWSPQQQYQYYGATGSRFDTTL